MSKTEYAYTVGEVGTAIKTYNFTYGNAWKDQLTAFDGSAIAYDNGGNPTSYLGKTLTWSKGRLLAKYINGYTTIGNQYDANGLRRAKTKTNTTPGVIGDIVSTSYFYGTDGKLVKESTQGYTRYYFYSSDGIVGYTENGEKFLYRKNLFGDITAIYKGTQKVAEYIYDAWGNCKVTFDTNGYGTRNPFRYRGYYWDNDFGMYYLMTRYYDPKIGRFINADSLEYLAPETLNGLNLYAYCSNNPVMNIDIYGNACKRSPYLLMPFDSMIKNQSQGTSVDSTNTIFAEPFEYGLVTPEKFPNDRMPTYAFYVRGNVGLYYSPKDGYSFASLRLGVIDTTIKTDKFFGEDALINPNAFVDIGALNASVSVGFGISGIVEIVSAGVGIQVGDVFSISVKGYVGAGFFWDFGNGIEIGGGLPVGLILSINFDWFSWLKE